MTYAKQRRETTDEALAKAARLLKQARLSAESASRTKSRAKDRAFEDAKAVFSDFGMSARGLSKEKVINRAASLKRQSESDGLTFRAYSSERQRKAIQAAAKRFSINPESVTSRGFFAPVPKGAEKIRVSGDSKKLVVSYVKGGSRHRRVAVAVSEKSIPHGEGARRRFIKEKILRGFRPAGYSTAQWAESVFGWTTKFHPGESVPAIDKYRPTTEQLYDEDEDENQPTEKQAPRARVFIVEYVKPL